MCRAGAALRKLVGCGDVLTQVFLAVMEVDIVLHQELMHLHPGAVAQKALDFAFRQPSGAIGFDGQRFEGGAGKVPARRGELGGEGARISKVTCMGLRVAGCGGWVGWRAALMRW
jgi:hypothetical protein